MDVLLGFIIMAAVLGAVWFLFMRPGAQLGKAVASPSLPSTAAATPIGGVKLTPDLGALKPGDAVSFWDGTDTIVRGSLDCREDVGDRVVEWRWLFLSGNRVLELMPHGQALYDSGAVAHQGDDMYEMLVGAGGLLKRFEGNVREGIANEPVQVVLDDEGAGDGDGTTYRVRSTGVFGGTRVGDLPENAEVWADVSPDASQNVFFKLVRDDDTDDKDIALGIWTTHILVLRGRLIDRSEITGIYAT